jgi:hypothetical protein
MGFSLFGKKPSVERDPYGTLNPEQKALVQKMGPYLLGRIGNVENNMYTGDYTSPLTQNEQEMISRNARLSALGEQGLQPLLRGEFPEEYYQSAIYRPMLKRFQEDIQPVLEEQYAGPSGGGYWGSARAGAVGKGYRDLIDTATAERGKLAWNVQQNVPLAIGAANALSKTEAEIQQIPRLIEQYGLDQKYKEWVRANEADQQYINDALNFLNISTVTEKYKKGQKGLIGDLGALVGAAIGTLIAPGVGTGMGAQLGGSIGGQFDESGYDGGSQLGSMFSMFGGMGGGGGGGGAPSTFGTYQPMSSLSSNYNSRLSAMDWRNTGNYPRLGGFNYS